MSDIGPEGRSYEGISRSDLRRLGEIAREDRDDFFIRKPDWGQLYKDRVLLVALCQGAAEHYVRRDHGVNDFDVYTFYAANSDRPWYAKRLKVADFGDPRFGTSVGKPQFAGRKVDLMGRGIDHSEGEDPREAVARWLGGSSLSARLLAERPVVVISPDEWCGEVMWDPASGGRTF